MLFPLHVVASVNVDVTVGAVPSPKLDGFGLIHRLKTSVDAFAEATMNWVVLVSSNVVAHADDPLVAAA
jgi:hypothetical protein